MSGCLVLMSDTNIGQRVSLCKRKMQGKANRYNWGLIILYIIEVFDQNPIQMADRKKKKTGPKPLYDEPMKPYRVVLPEDLRDRAAKVGGGNFSRGVRILIEEHMEDEVGA